MTERQLWTPREWQPPAVGHIRDNPRSALFMTMGGGKGGCTLTGLYDALLTEDLLPALALGPKRVAENVWPKEVGKWQHLSDWNCVSLVGDERHRLRAVKYDSPFYSINYEQLPWLFKHWGEKNWPYKTIICDESTKLKNFRGSAQVSSKGKEFVRASTGVRAGALSKVVHTPRVKRIHLLTGTPSPNGLQDLWSQIWFLDKGERLGRTFEGFSQRWFRPNHNGFGIAPLPHAADEIQDKIRDLCLTIDVADYLDLKGPIVNNIYVQLPPAAMKLYREMEKEMFTRLEDERTVEAFGAAAKTQKCLQLANGAVYVDPLTESDNDSRSREWRPVHDAKLAALDSVIEESGGAKMMVVYAFRSDLARILKAYPKQAVDLGTTAGFKAFLKGNATVGLCHPDSLGHGVDGLQEVCNTITHFGHGWNLETYLQVNARVGEIRQIQSGYDRPVYVNHIIAEGTVDELVIERRDTKREVQDILMDALKRWGAQ